MRCRASMIWQGGRVLCGPLLDHIRGAGSGCPPARPHADLGQISQVHCRLCRRLDPVLLCPDATVCLAFFRGWPQVGGVGRYQSGYQPPAGWFFCLAFVSIGLESNFRELAKQMEGGKPMILYVVGQSFNLILTLAVAWLAFVVLFPNAI